jgi:hypothetical protein
MLIDLFVYLFLFVSLETTILGTNIILNAKQTAKMATHAMHIVVQMVLSLHAGLHATPIGQTHDDPPVRSSIT